MGMTKTTQKWCQCALQIRRLHVSCAPYGQTGKCTRCYTHTHTHTWTTVLSRNGGPQERPSKMQYLSVEGTLRTRPTVGPALQIVATHAGWPVNWKHFLLVSYPTQYQMWRASDTCTVRARLLYCGGFASLKNTTDTQMWPVESIHNVAIEQTTSHNNSSPPITIFRNCSSEPLSAKIKWCN